MISFGPFLFSPAERSLLKGGNPVRLGSRSLDILGALVERAGEVVSRRVLVKRAWPDLEVEESSLRCHVAALRRTLGDGRNGARYVVNVPGRGYCFVARISRTESQGTVEPTASTQNPESPNLPPKLDGMLGRQEAMAHLVSQIARERLVSIVGPGGMGKTTVAVAVAHALTDQFQNSVHFIDLGSIEDAKLAVPLIARALALPEPAGDSSTDLFEVLRQRRCLLVLDGCEHLIASIPALVERIGIEAPQIHIVATSREALRTEGERVYRLPPLGMPSPEAEGPLTLAEAMEFPAVRLFMERTEAAGGASINVLSDADVPVVVGICRKLDGIPLALELVAGRAAVDGIHAVGGSLAWEYTSSWPGRRTAPLRHQTLNAMLDWSYDRLTADEQRALRHLSVFVGRFSLEAAQDVLAEDGARTPELLGSLTRKSLVSTQTGDESAPYRLLEITRSYALAKLAETDELSAVALRHAKRVLTYLSTARARSQPGSPIVWPWRFDPLGDVRAALEWCFSPSGNVSIGGDLVRTLMRG